MKVLLLAPQPFYQERGTPIAVDLLVRSLSTQGHAVDLLTYHEGAPVAYPNVRLLRIPHLPFIRGVGPGLSWKKLVCDAVMFLRAIQLAGRTHYDVVHAVEESVFMAMAIKRWFGIPYVYDMDSSMPDQIADKHPALRGARGLLRRMEGATLRRAEAVVPVCDALADIAARHQAQRVVVLRDVSLLSINGHGDRPVVNLRQELGITGPIVMYVGNLERYQGIDLLLESFALAAPRAPGASLVVIGGQPAAVQSYQAMAERLGIAASTHFVGPRPVAHIAAYLQAADVLVSPRLLGGNTPMKVYSYLDSGRAVLATDLPTHTQVMTPEVAELRPPVPSAFADGLVRLLGDAGYRQKLATAAHALVQARHSYATFSATVAGLYETLAHRAAAPDRGRTAHDKRRVWKRTTGTLGWVLRAAASAILLWVVVQRLELSQVGQLLRHIRWEWLGLGFGALLINRVLSISRMIIMVKAKGIAYEPKHIAHIVLASQFYGWFLPTGVGGDVLRIYGLARHTDNTAEAASAVLLERSLGMLGLLVMGFAGALWAWPHLDDRRILWAALVPSTVGLVAGGLALNERWMTALTRWMDVHAHRWVGKIMAWLAAVRAYRYHQRAVIEVLAISIIIHFFRIISVYCSGRALGAALPFQYYLAFVPLILLTAQLPISIGGWGVRENVFVHSFQQLGLPPAVSFSMSVVSHVLQVIATIPGGMWSMWSTIHGPRAAAAERQP